MLTGVWICPSCAREFLEPDGDCPECGLAPVSPDELRMSKSVDAEGWEYFPVGRLRHPGEEEALAGLFESRRIPLAVRGDGVLLVPGPQIQEATVLIEDFRSEEEALPGDFPPEEVEEAGAVPTAVEKAKPRAGKSRAERRREQKREKKGEKKRLGEGLETRLSLSFTLRSVRPNSWGRWVDLSRWVIGFLTEGGWIWQIGLELTGPGRFDLPEFLGMLFFLVVMHVGFFVRRDVGISPRGLEFRLWLPPPITYRRLPVEDIRWLRVGSEFVHPKPRRGRDQQLHRVEVGTKWGLVVLAANIGDLLRAHRLAETWSRVLDRPVIEDLSR